MNRLGIILTVIVVLLIAASSTLFVVDQRRFAVLYALGEIKEVITDPGLHAKLPTPLENVVYIDRRIQNLDSLDPRPIFTAEKQSLVVDWLVKWRVTDPRQFIRNNGIDIGNAETRLAPVIQAAFNDAITRRTVREVVATARDQVMQAVRVRLDREAREFGISIVDVRIKRVDFSANITDAVYRRMESERKRVANERRSTGAAAAETIRADADRQREVIVAEAYRDAQKLKGEGDSQAADIYAQAFGRDPQFAKFYRSLQAYRQSLAHKSDVLVLDPSGNEFFQDLGAGRGTAH